MTLSGWSRANHDFAQRTATKLGRVGASRSAVGDMHRSQKSAITSGPEKTFLPQAAKRLKQYSATPPELAFTSIKHRQRWTFGCGMGRLTRALAEYFPECVGVDISPTMITLAREFNHHLPNCYFQLNEDIQLKSLPDNYFGFIYTSLVLQHIAEPCSHEYLAELIRVLRPGWRIYFSSARKAACKFACKSPDKIGIALTAAIRSW